MGHLGHDLDNDNLTHAGVRAWASGFWVMGHLGHIATEFKSLDPLWARAGGAGVVETVHHTVYNIYLYYSYLIIK